MIHNSAISRLTIKKTSLWKCLDTRTDWKWRSSQVTRRIPEDHWLLGSRNKENHVNPAQSAQLFVKIILSTGLKNRIKSSALCFTPLSLCHQHSLLQSAPSSRLHCCAKRFYLCWTVCQYCEPASHLFTQLSRTSLWRWADWPQRKTEDWQICPKPHEAGSTSHSMILMFLERMSVLAQRLINSFDLVRETGTPGK